MKTLDDLLAIWNHGTLRGAPRMFAKKIGVGEGTVSRWRSGDYPPDPDLRSRVAKELSVSVDKLLDACRRMKSLKKQALSPVKDMEAMLLRETGYRFMEIPYLGVVCASRFAFSFDLPPEHFATLAIKASSQDRYAMLRISGDCMAPRIEDGDEVLIKQTDSVRDGTIAIVCWDGECTMKRVYKRKDGVELKADNPEYKPIKVCSSKIRVVAEVVKIIKDPRRMP